MSLREGLHVMMQCYMRQQFADRYWNVPKMRSESSEHVRTTTGFFTVGESKWRCGAIWKSMHRKFGPKLTATILKALREQLKENDQLHSVEEIAGLVPEIPLEYDQIMKGGGKFWDDVNGGYLPEDLVLTVRREEIDSGTF